MSELTNMDKDDIIASLESRLASRDAELTALRSENIRLRELQLVNMDGTHVHAGDVLNAEILIEKMSGLISEAAPLAWAFGRYEDMVESARAWEKKAQILLAEILEK